ncbi:carboxylesterase/lipase family protein [Spirillospora sp. CA-294931]|uniref:carboxylesterase/lipase family protein n=1 Tax=Spirillospora sp. CA-294931 TaxID=3240042 RepID=UPI003D94B2F2
MSLVVRTDAGRVRGAAHSGLFSFKGIPFAAPPEGELRFGAPARPKKWDGVRDAFAFATAAPQRPLAPGAPPLWSPGDGLDCLALNVWTPDPGAAGLPVMVWLHGGGWLIGGTAMPGYDATVLAGHGVVVVTVGYRLGFEGFGHVPGAPGNRGLRDQIAALEWVRANIAAFGGDPGNVTVFGQSAGAASIALLLSSTRGLFRRAIAQSVPDGYHSVEEAGAVTGRLAEKAGVAPTREGLAALPPEAFLEVPGDVGPVVDGDLVTGPPWESLGGKDVDLICGFTHEEYRLYPRGGELAAMDKAAAYRAAHPETSDPELFTMLMSDMLFRMPSTWVAEAHAASGGRTWLYDFAWRGPEFGACHTVDVPFVFGNGDTRMAARVLGSPPPADFAPLSKRMRDAWTSFAATGDPGWPRFEAGSRVTRVWDTEPSDGPYPLDASREIWS